MVTSKSMQILTRKSFTCNRKYTNEHICVYNLCLLTEY